MATFTTYYETKMSNVKSNVKFNIKHHMSLQDARSYAIKASKCGPEGLFVAIMRNGINVEMYRNGSKVEA